MAYIPPADKLLHAVLCALVTLAALPFGWRIAAAACSGVAIGREVYGRWKRARPMTRDDWIESGRDILAGLAGGGVVLAGAFIGL